MEPVKRPHRPSRMVCMPVGGTGIRATTAQLLVAIYRVGAAEVLAAYEGHLIPARNLCWDSAIEIGARRVLWMDSDIYAPIGQLQEFLDRADEQFEKDPLMAWIGAVCVRRGGGLAMEVSTEADKYPVLMGMGLAYWHTERMQKAIGQANEGGGFAWVPPFGEDYRACAQVWDAHFKVSYDPRLPTKHLGIGDWPGAEMIESERSES